MNRKYLLFPVIAAATMMLNVSSAIANNGLTFPPADVLNNYQYPLQAPVAPTFNGISSRPAPYVFGQKNIQAHPQMIPTPAQANSFRNLPVQPKVMSNNNQAPFVPQIFGNNFNQNTGNRFPFSNKNMMPFGNNGNNSFNPFPNANMPFSNNSGGMMPKNPMTSMFDNNTNNQNWNMPFLNSNNNNRKKAWGNKRNIWPDFYTDFTDEAWDTMSSSPRKMGRMPGGWRFPYISMPDPVTVSDAIANQFPPIAEEAGNMADFSDWGVFDNK